ncbi:YidB family protein [Stenotrophomonas sp. 22385]|uniref:YidB family protein n=1 Tax=Stenotrophomonas sp. 22385 TaxID=3453915 RepID=UPI003F8266C1
MILMSPVGTLIENVTRVSGLGDKAGTLIGVLAGFMFAEPGGFMAFRDRFCAIGLGDVFDSWMGGHPNMRYTNGNEMRHALGVADMRVIAERTGLPESVLAGVMAAAVPQLVRAVTPGGRLPTAMPADLEPLARTCAQAEPAAVQDRDAAPARNIRRWRWLLPLLPLSLLAYCGWQGSTADSADAALKDTRHASPG